MEGLFFIVIAAFVYSVYSVVKSFTSDDAGVDVKPITGEVFPTIDVFNTVVEEPVVRENNRAKHKPVAHKRVDTDRPRTVVQQKEQPQEEKAAGERLVRFSNKSDAKRAFIYSEIFNRKY
ncbi:MAG: hypothetical protein IJB01_08235 [Bacteroidaceae bacterium]|nr:hypothetical protein [Bacteroidaceae bacterium]